MVAEIKVLGADYQGKMRYALDSDVERLKAIQDPGLERYMLLVIPNSEVRSALGDHLTTVCYSSNCVERDYPKFKLRLWRLDTQIACADGELSGSGANSNQGGGERCE